MKLQKGTQDTEVKLTPDPLFQLTLGTAYSLPMFYPANGVKAHLEPHHAHVASLMPRGPQCTGAIC